jgi:hypothetical protein
MIEQCTLWCMSQITVRFRDTGGTNSPADPSSVPRAFIAITRRGRAPPEKRLVNRSGADGMAARCI